MLTARFRDQLKRYGHLNFEQTFDLLDERRDTLARYETALTFYAAEGKGGRVARDALGDTPSQGEPK